MPEESIAYQKAFLFAKRIVSLYHHLTRNHQEYVLSKQILRSGTSIGASIAQARCGYSRKDFAAKTNLYSSLPNLHSIQKGLR